MVLEYLISIAALALFQDSGSEKLDLASLMDAVPEDIRGRVILKMEGVHTRNQERVHNLDSTVRGIYSIAVGLVNDIWRSFGVTASWCLLSVSAAQNPEGGPSANHIQGQ